MGDLIRGDAIVTDDQTVLSLEDFLAANDKHVGVLIEPDDDLEAILGHLGEITLIALSFPAFSDGRGYSSAAMLRRHHDFQGEIRAVGDVRIDQLEQMVRCGINAYELADGQDSALAIEKLKGFSFSYQQTVDRAPLYRQR